MRVGNDVFRFGPYELDSNRRRLWRGGEPVALPDRHVAILLLLASHAGQIVTKDALGEAGWPGDAAVGDNSIVQVIKSLRNTLGNQDRRVRYIETVPRLGYRLLVPVEHRQPPPRQPSVPLDALLARDRAVVEGRAELETLNRDALGRAHQAFGRAVLAVPDDPAGHVGLATACVFAFETTRVDAAPDLAALQRANLHAREGCRLDPVSGEAWATFALVMHRMGNPIDAIAAGRRAVALDPNNWQHYVRLAEVSWGERRLRAAYRALALCPGLAQPRWFASTVFIARQAFDAALEELREGCAAQDAQRNGSGRFNAVGLHLLHGLVLAARGADDEAFEQFTRERAVSDDRQVYERECAAATWYASGALHLRQGRCDDAAAAFHEALKRVPNHALAAIGLAASGGREGRDSPSSNAVNAATVHAAVLALGGRHGDAARIYGEALVEAPPGSAGWMLPVEPLLHATAHPAIWAPALTMLRDRAT